MVKTMDENNDSSAEIQNLKNQLEIERLKNQLAQSNSNSNAAASNNNNNNSQQQSSTVVIGGGGHGGQRQVTYCGPISWLIGCFLFPCICCCPVDKKWI